MTETKFRLRASLWYDFKLAKNGVESHRDLCKVFGEDAISESQCRRWFQRFREGNQSLEDENHQRRPPAIDSAVLKQAIEMDPRQTTRELTEIFRVSPQTISEHLNQLGKTSRIKQCQ